MNPAPHIIRLDSLLPARPATRFYKTWSFEGSPGPHRWTVLSLEDGVGDGILTIRVEIPTDGPTITGRIQISQDPKTALGKWYELSAFKGLLATEIEGVPAHIVCWCNHANVLVLITNAALTLRRRAEQVSEHAVADGTSVF